MLLNLCIQLGIAVGSPSSDLKRTIFADVIGWSDLMKLGADTDEDQLTGRQKLMAINQCATLVYTSGTTGMPKGQNPFTIESHKELQLVRNINSSSEWLSHYTYALTNAFEGLFIR